MAKDKLTYFQRLDICRLYKTRDPESGKLLSQYDLAETYGVSHSTIKRTLDGYKAEQERVDAEKAKDLEANKALKELASNTKDLATQILKKLVLPFAKAGIKVKLTPDEQQLVQKLFKEVNKP